MHPLIRLLSFIVFAAFVSLGNVSSIILGLLVLGGVWLVSKAMPSVKAWIMIKRLRIFFLSICVMYLWFTPGELIFPILDHWSPTYDGLIQGIMRVLALIILVLGVESLLRLTDRQLLLAGLYYLVTPFQWVGIDRERFILRVILTLESVTMVASPTLKPIKYLDEVEIGGKYVSFWAKKREIIHRYMVLISERLVDKLSDAANAPVDLKVVEFEITALPNWRQWLVPLTMIMLFTVAESI